MRLLIWSALLMVVGGSGAVQIDVAHGTAREEAARTRLQKLITSNDLGKLIVTRHAVIEEGAVNHAFPVLTLNAHFADSDDDLLASFVHEQIHWALRAKDNRQRAAIADLRRMYPIAPVGPPQGAETLYSTYGHLITCYLEVQAVRHLLGPERTAAVIANKHHYTWIYDTVLRDEQRIAAVVARHRLAPE